MPDRKSIRVEEVPELRRVMAHTAATDYASHVPAVSNPMEAEGRHTGSAEADCVHSRPARREVAG